MKGLALAILCASAVVVTGQTIDPSWEEKYVMPCVVDTHPGKHGMCFLYESNELGLILKFMDKPRQTLFIRYKNEAGEYIYLYQRPQGIAL